MPSLVASLPRPRHDSSTGRTVRRRGRTGVGGLGVVLVLASAVVVVAGGTWWQVADRVADRQEAADAALAGGLRCFGAAALEPGCSAPLGDLVVPDAVDARRQARRNPLLPRCFTGIDADDVRTCTFGDAQAARHVVLFGDSHALQWMPALEPLLADRGWRLTTVLRASCTPNLETTARPVRAQQERCHRWALAAVARIEEDPTVDVVITTAMDNKNWVAVRENSYRTGFHGYQRTWGRFTSRGMSVVVIADTPRPRPGPPSVQDCVANGSAASRCGRARDAALHGQFWRSGNRPPMVQAGLTSGPLVHVVDLSDAFCTPVQCPAVVGNVLVYADDNHMTATYAATLSERLGSALDQALGGSSAQR